jgi:hypothetical protein
MPGRVSNDESGGKLDHAVLTPSARRWVVPSHLRIFITRGGRCRKIFPESGQPGCSRFETSHHRKYVIRAFRGRSRSINSRLVLLLQGSWVKVSYSSPKYMPDGLLLMKQSTHAATVRYRAHLVPRKPVSSMIAMKCVVTSHAVKVLLC